jgi:hypothetical protein
MTSKRAPEQRQHERHHRRTSGDDHDNDEDYDDGASTTHDEDDDNGEREHNEAPAQSSPPPPPLSAIPLDNDMTLPNREAKDDPSRSAVIDGDEPSPTTLAAMMVAAAASKKQSSSSQKLSAKPKTKVSSSSKKNAATAAKPSTMAPKSKSTPKTVARRAHESDNESSNNNNDSGINNGEEDMWAVAGVTSDGPNNAGAVVTPIIDTDDPTMTSIHQLFLNQKKDMKSNVTKQQSTKSIKTPKKTTPTITSKGNIPAPTRTPSSSSSSASPVVAASSSTSTSLQQSNGHTPSKSAKKLAKKIQSSSPPSFMMTTHSNSSKKMNPTNTKATPKKGTIGKKAKTNDNDNNNVESATTSSTPSTASSSSSIPVAVGTIELPNRDAPNVMVTPSSSDVAVPVPPTIPSIASASSLSSPSQELSLPVVIVPTTAAALPPSTAPLPSALSPQTSPPVVVVVAKESQSPIPSRRAHKSGKRQNHRSALVDDQSDSDSSNESRERDRDRDRDPDTILNGLTELERMELMARLRVDADLREAHQLRTLQNDSRGDNDAVLFRPSLSARRVTDDYLEPTRDHIPAHERFFHTHLLKKQAADAERERRRQLRHTNHYDRPSKSSRHYDDHDEHDTRIGSPTRTIALRLHEEAPLRTQRRINDKEASNMNAAAAPQQLSSIATPSLTPLSHAATTITRLARQVEETFMTLVNTPLAMNGVATVATPPTLAQLASSEPTLNATQTTELFRRLGFLPPLPQATPARPRPADVSAPLAAKLIAQLDPLHTGAITLPTLQAFFADFTATRSSDNNDNNSNNPLTRITASPNTPISPQQVWPSSRHLSAALAERGGTTTPTPARGGFHGSSGAIPAVTMPVATVASPPSVRRTALTRRQVAATTAAAAAVTSNSSISMPSADDSIDGGRRTANTRSSNTQRYGQESQSARKPPRRQIEHARASHQKYAHSDNEDGSTSSSDDNEELTKTIPRHHNGNGIANDYVDPFVHQQLPRDDSKRQSRRAAHQQQQQQQQQASLKPAVAVPAVAPPSASYFGYPGGQPSLMTPLHGHPIPFPYYYPYAAYHLPSSQQMMPATMMATPTQTATPMSSSISNSLQTPLLPAPVPLMYSHASVVGTPITMAIPSIPSSQSSTSPSVPVPSFYGIPHPLPSPATPNAHVHAHAHLSPAIPLGPITTTGVTVASVPIATTAASVIAPSLGFQIDSSTASEPSPPAPDHITIDVSQHQHMNRSSSSAPPLPTTPIPPTPQLQGTQRFAPHTHAVVVAAAAVTAPRPSTQQLSPITPPILSHAQVAARVEKLLATAKMYQDNKKRAQVIAVAKQMEECTFTPETRASQRSFEMTRPLRDHVMGRSPSPPQRKHTLGLIASPHQQEVGPARSRSSDDHNEKHDVDDDYSSGNPSSSLPISSTESGCGLLGNDDNSHESKASTSEFVVVPTSLPELIESNDDNKHNVTAVHHLVSDTLVSPEAISNSIAPPDSTSPTPPPPGHVTSLRLPPNASDDGKKPQASSSSTLSGARHVTSERHEELYATASTYRQRRQQLVESQREEAEAAARALPFRPQINPAPVYDRATMPLPNGYDATIQRLRAEKARRQQIIADAARGRQIAPIRHTSTEFRPLATNTTPLAGGHNKGNVQLHKRVAQANSSKEHGASTGRVLPSTSHRSPDYLHTITAQNQHAITVVPPLPPHRGIASSSLTTPGIPVGTLSSVIGGPTHASYAARANQASIFGSRPASAPSSSSSSLGISTDPLLTRPTTASGHARVSLTKIYDMGRSLDEVDREIAREQRELQEAAAMEIISANVSLATTPILTSAPMIPPLPLAPFALLPPLPPSSSSFPTTPIPATSASGGSYQQSEAAPGIQELVESKAIVSVLPTNNTNAPLPIVDENDYDDDDDYDDANDSKGFLDNNDDNSNINGGHRRTVSLSSAPILMYAEVQISETQSERLAVRHGDDLRALATEFVRTHYLDIQHVDALHDMLIQQFQQLVPIQQQQSISPTTPAAVATATTASITSPNTLPMMPASPPLPSSAPPPLPSASNNGATNAIPSSIGGSIASSLSTTSIAASLSSGDDYADDFDQSY